MPHKNKKHWVKVHRTGKRKGTSKTRNQNFYKSAYTQQNRKDWQNKKTSILVFSDAQVQAFKKDDSLSVILLKQKGNKMQSKVAHYPIVEGLKNSFRQNCMRSLLVFTPARTLILEDPSKEKDKDQHTKYFMHCFADDSLQNLKENKEQWALVMTSLQPGANRTHEGKQNWCQHIMEPSIFIKQAELAKPNLEKMMKKGFHHGSTGKYFCFGSRGGIKKDNGCSVGQYADHNKTASQNCISAMDKVFKDLRAKVKENLGCDVLNIMATQLHATHNMFPGANNDLKGRMKLFSGLASIFMCFDAATEQMHTEKDWTYTVVTLPQQQWNHKGSEHQLTFNFSFSEKQSIQVQMVPGTIILYHGALVFHRQQHKGISNETDTPCCLNLSGYANGKLRDSCQCTLRRLNQLP